jgi:acyl transferase domain-containing protein/thioesterase domain-containing protein/acyl carrier protein
MHSSAISDHQTGFEIAIIGMSGRFPGARDIDEFWQNLREGRESITFFSDEALAFSDIDPAVLNDSRYVKARGVLEGAELFDASFFGFSPREAEIMDPQHRIFLECAWEALENAGYDPEQYKGSIGVYAGVSMNTYLLNNLYVDGDFTRSVTGLHMRIGSDKDFLTTRVSYALNLAGPSVAVQTTCSTSLVAVHLACQSLLSGECDIALAGGVSLRVPQKAGYVYQEGGIYSPDGHCRAFDARAQGTVGGNGVGIVVLKRLQDALADGDCMQAVIKGSAINNDGALKVGYTAPSVDGQARVIARALAMAETDPETVSYIEAHGTGTTLGDPIEIAALTQAFRASTEKKGFCAIGSVKTNIGHLDVAAGVAGLIKTVLALKRHELPPSLYFEQPNPQIPFANSPFYVNTTLSEWRTGTTPRRAGVSSFGMGGTNAHVVLEEAPPREPSGASRPLKLLILAAKTPTALERATANLVTHLKQHPNLNPADVAYTLQVGRKEFSHRRTVVCRDLDEAVIALETLDPQRVWTHVHDPKERPIAFMFPGQGTQYVHMGCDLYQGEPTFREHVNHCAELLQPHLQMNLRDVLYPSDAEREVATYRLRQTSITQPALFVIEYALAKLWMAWGVHPQAMIGHSIGEYVAACLAGVFSLEDALTLVAARGRLMQSLPAGAMLVVPLSQKEVELLLGESLSLASINGLSLCLVSGPTDAVEGLETQLIQRGIACRRLHTSHAFHSAMMEPIIEPFTAQAQTVNLKPPQIPYISNVTGTWITAAEATSPRYWARHLRHTVRFVEGLHELLQDAERILLEVGPGQTLNTLAKQCPDNTTGRVVLSSLRHPHDQLSDVAFLLHTVDRLWLAGVQVDWSGFYAHERRYRVPLPTYPFERQRYWVEPQKQACSPSTRQGSLRKKRDIADWFYIPSWKQSILSVPFRPDAPLEQKRAWLVFSNRDSLSSNIVKRLKQEGQDVITVMAGKEFGRLSESVYTVNPKQGDDYGVLLTELRALDKIPQIIIHLWSVTPDNRKRSGSDVFENFQDLGFYSLLFLAQALAQQHIITPLRIGVVSNNLQEVTGEEVLYPEKATLLGPCKVIPQEYPHIRCLSIDIVLPQSGTWHEENLIDRLIAELAAKPPDVVLAYRGNRRWIQTFEAVRLDLPSSHTIRLREGGVYFITGGLGRIGLVIAECLARKVGAKLILLGRSTFPGRDKWKQWLATHGDEDDVSCKIRKVQELEELGAESLIVSADVANEEHMQAVIAQTYKRFGTLHGVIHAAGIVREIATRTIPATGHLEGEGQFRPKVHGAYVLERVLQGRKLDFCLLLSSLSSILGGLGFSAYSGANLFMDAFAHKHNQTSPVPWISINWDAWRFEEKGQSIAMGATLAQLAITPKEGMEVFQRVLSLDPLTQLVVSTGDLHARIDQYINLEPLRDTEQAKSTVSSSLYSRSNLSNIYVAPSNELEQSIAEIWQKLLGIASVGIHDNFFELGGHSLQAVQLFAHIEKRFGTRLPLATLFQAPTVAHLARLLCQADHVPSWSSLVAIQPHGSKPPFFCVHAGYGEVLFYHDFADLLGPDQPVYGLQPRGLDGKLRPHTSLEDMAAHYITEIRSFQPEGPYCVGGWCFGGLVAFEIAQQLQAQGHHVAVLAMIDANVPPAIRSSFSYYVHHGVYGMTHCPVMFLRYALHKGWDQMRPRRQRVPQFQPLQDHTWQDVLRHHYEAQTHYVPHLYPGRIAWFVNSARAHLSPYPWSKLAAEGLDQYIVPGNHETMFRKPHVRVLAEKLRVCLEAAQGREMIHANGL